MSADEQVISAKAGVRAIRRRDAPSVELTQVVLRYLLSSDVAPGQRIPSERQLADALDIGRTSLREALKSLTLLGLLEVRRGSGTYLSSSASQLLPRVIDWGLMLGNRTVDDLIEARYHLEVTVSGLAAQRADAAAVADLERILAEMRHCGDDFARFIDLDVEFHLRLARASGNQVLSDVLVSISSLLRVWGERVIPWLGETETSYDLHPAIVAAVAHADAEAARAAMTDHMQIACDNLRNTVQAERSSASPSAEPGPHLRAPGPAAAPVPAQV